MADIKPLRVDTAGQTAAAQVGETVGVVNGGTGATTAAAARTSLGLAIGTNVEAWSADLDSLAALSTTVGIPARTATNTWNMRTLTGSTRVSVANGTGVAGNPTFDLNTYADSGVGTFLKLTRDSLGFVSGTTAVVQADITGLVNSVYAPINNPTFTGTVTLAADPASALQAATKQYVDAYAMGQRVKDSVRAATTAALPANTRTGNVLTSTSNVALTAQDGITLALNERLLVKNEATGANNGVYTVTAVGSGVAAWTLTRATDFDGAGEVVGGATFWVNEGTTQADSGWTLTTDDPITVNTTALTFTQSSGLGQVTASAPLSKTGNTISAVLSARVVNTGGAFDLQSGVATGGTYTKVTVDTYGRVTLGATAVPSDVGAQPVDAGLTSIAALTGGGGLYATATDTFVMRTMTASGGITLTNADGVAGAPAFALTTGVVTPGTYSSVTVDTTGRVTAGATSSSTSLSDSFTNNNVGTIVIGRAVYATTTTDKVDLANANAAATAQVIGLVSATSIAAAAAGAITFAGVMAATTVQWDVVTGQTGGLTPGSMYFLSNVTAGALTTTAPTTGYLCAVGRAMSTTKMALRFDPTIQL